MILKRPGDQRLSNTGDREKNHYTDIYNFLARRISDQVVE